jgi:myo-inositol-1(or 4)-monophosphatase
VRWVVDPIDGTTNFLYGLPAYAVSIAAEVDGQVVAGVVLNAATGELWSATAGGGAHLTVPGTDPVRLTGSRPASLAQALVATGFGYRAEHRRAQAAVVAALLPEVRDIRRYGSSALDLCTVAAGRVDAYYELHLNRWDFAAGALVAAEAGSSSPACRAGRSPSRWGSPWRRRSPRSSSRCWTGCTALEPGPLVSVP